MILNNKEKNTRIVKFEADYLPNSRKERKNKDGEIIKPAGQPIYRKGETAAIHVKLVASLEKKGAKMKVSKLDKESVVKRRQKAMKESDRKAYED